MEDRDVILYIGGFELPDKNAAAHRVLSNAKIFRKIGKKVIFIGIDKSLSFDSDILKTTTIVQGFEAYSLPYPANNVNWIRYLTEIDEYVKVIEKIENVEMIIFYNFQSIAMNRLMHYCKRNKLKCYADITEWRSAKGENFIYRILKDGDTWFRMHILHKKLNGMIVISRYLEEYYKKYKNVTYVPALIDFSESKWNNNYQKSTSILKLVYAGNPGRKDRLDRLIDALEDVNREYRLDIIGITKEQYLEYFPRDNNILLKNKNIIFHGRLSHLDTLEFVKKANYSCFFRENDRVSKAGFPTKFVEAISCGTPVITNKTSNLDEYVRDGLNGIFVKSLEKKDLIECLNKIPYKIDVTREVFDLYKYITNLSQLFRE